MGNKILIAILCTFSFMGLALADDHEGDANHGHDHEKKPFSIYGDFATSTSFQGNEGSGTGFAGGPHDDFNLDLAEINVEKNWSKSKLHISFGWGGVPLNFSGATQTIPDGAGGTTEQITRLSLMNAYYFWTHDCGFSLTAGLFESPMGYETFTPYDNMQYTRSWGYGLVPYFLGGLAGHYSFGEMGNAALYVVNGSQGNSGDTDKHKTMAITVDLKPMDKLAIDLRYMWGVDSPLNGPPVTGFNDFNATILEVTLAYMVNDAFDVALDYTTRSVEGRRPIASEAKTATSIAAYLNGHFGMVGAALRYEMFDYEAGSFSSMYNGYNVITGTENKIGALTLAVNAEIDQNAKILLEYRMDSSDDQIWTDKDGNATDSMDVITAALMYRF